MSPQALAVLGDTILNSFIDDREHLRGRGHIMSAHGVSEYLCGLAAHALLLCLEGIKKRLECIVAHEGLLRTDGGGGRCSRVHQRCLHLPYEILTQSAVSWASGSYTGRMHT